MHTLLIIGGSDAGISAALRAKELDPACEATIILEDEFPNYSICGLPFYLSKEVPDYHQLAHRTYTDITNAGISLLLNHRATDIEDHTVIVEHQGKNISLPYDKLVIATGAKAKRPHIEGLDLLGVFQLHTMDDSFTMEQYIEEHAPRTALIVGAGYIGLEMADALTLRGLSVTLVEHGPSVLKTVDVSLGTLIHDELVRHDIVVKTGIAVQQITQDSATLRVSGSPDLDIQTDLVLVATGVEPRSELAVQAGIETGIQGAIRVTLTMETNIPDIYAAGDCVETWHRLTQRPTYLPLGTTSHKQGRVAGANALGKHTLFAGTLGTQVVKVFNLVAARTGLRDDEAQEAGFEPFTLESTYWDHKVYYPHAQRIHMRLTGDRKTGRLIGAQMVGPVQTEVAKRIDIIATALFHDMTIDALSDLDLSYTPPLGSPWDVVQMMAQDWIRANR